MKKDNAVRFRPRPERTSYSGYRQRKRLAKLAWLICGPALIIIGFLVVQPVNAPKKAAQATATTTAKPAQAAAVPAEAAGTLVCSHLSITDGDTLRCNGVRVRLLGIDAPELPGHCSAGRSCTPGDPYAAKSYLVSITRTTVQCDPDGLDRYGRTLARCSAAGIDLSCAMLKSGHAVPRYSPITCR